jgi:DNA primase catalytic core
MQMVPADELERLKRAFPIQQLAEAQGIKLRAHGKNLIGLCAFHDDHEPSLIITPDKNLWNCLGACGTGGTVIDWVMKAEGVTFRQAVEILREKAFPGGTVATSSPTTPATAEDREPLNQVTDYYHQTLKKSPEALSYLEKRGLNNPEMIEHFKIGYSNRSFGNQLPDKSRKEGAAIRARLTKTGILRESGHEHFNGCIVIPIFDERGGVAGMYGRKINDHLREGTAYHLYLPGPHKGVFNLTGLVGNTVILCEALIDALTFWCAGFRNVTTAYGVNGFTADHLEAFRKHEIEKVYIAYDRDEAGDKAAEKLSRELISEGFECFRVLFPRNLDANEYALRVKPPEKSLAVALQKAEWLGKGKRENIMLSSSSQFPEEPKEAAKWKNNFEKPPESAVSSPSGSPTGSPSIEEKNPGMPSHPSNEQEVIFPPLAKNAHANPPSTEPARTAPANQPGEPLTDVKDDEIIITVDTRRWRVRGLAKNTHPDQLKVNVTLFSGEGYFMDTFDLCSARGRSQFQKQAAEEIKIEETIIKSDLGKILWKLEELRAQHPTQEKPKEPTIEVSPEGQKEALELLQSPNLLERILSDFEKCGIVGEETNKLVGYLAAVSRKMENPLAVIIQSSSAAGKTSLMEAILAFMPEEERIKYSAMTGQSLFYMGETNLKHKILAIVEEEGAERASYALKLLQSEGELTIASTGKDPSTGKHITHEYRVEGPVMIFVTTTNVDIDEELQNRCIMLSVNESREQTRAIHVLQRQRRTLEGLIAKREKARILEIHRNAQRMLKPIPVINPYAPKLTFLDDRTRTRRDHEKYLNLIETIALLHQFQRPLKTAEESGRPFQYVEVTPGDIEIANRLADEIFGRSLDEMSPQTRRLLLLLEKMVTEACQRLSAEGRPLERSEFHFSQREVREYTGFGNTQVKTHLRRLEELEYLVAYRTGKGQNVAYELAYDGKGKDGTPFFNGLLAGTQLSEKCNYDGNRSGFSGEWSGEKANRSAPGRGEVMHLSGGGRAEISSGDKEPESVSEDFQVLPLKITSPVTEGKNPSYPHFSHPTPIFPGNRLPEAQSASQLRSVT